MSKVFLIYPTPEGSKEVSLDSKLTFGRGKDVDLRFDDGGLSRLHASIYRDGEKIWIVDENSTNGTFVNVRSRRQRQMCIRDSRHREQS